MKYYIALGLAVLAALVSAETKPKSLEYKVNDFVSVFISNQPCPITKFKKQYPWDAVAVKRIPGEGLKVKIETLNGCFNHDKDIIVIQWDDYQGQPSDVSKFPANLFLMEKIDGVL